MRQPVALRCEAFSVAMTGDSQPRMYRGLAFIPYSKSSYGYMLDPRQERGEVGTRFLVPRNLLSKDCRTPRLIPVHPIDPKDLRADRVLLGLVATKEAANYKPYNLSLQPRSLAVSQYAGQLTVSFALISASQPLEFTDGAERYQAIYAPDAKERFYVTDGLGHTLTLLSSAGIFEAEELSAV